MPPASPSRPPSSASSPSCCASGSTTPAGPTGTTPTAAISPGSCARPRHSGVQWRVATTVVAELGDLARFGHPRQLAAFVGLIPSQYSTGGHRRQGGITKTGNARARRTLIEAAWAYRYPAKVSPSIQQRLEALPPRIQDIGWKAPLRLCKRFRRLTCRGKHTNLVVTAVARELLAFMWVIAQEVSLKV
jgi:transposase